MPCWSGRIDSRAMLSYDIPAGYRLVEHLGEHRGSAVWRADDLEQGLAVALVFVEPFAWEPKRVSRFLRVMRQLAQLAHPNVVKVLDIGETEIGRGYAALELLKGNTLEQLIEQSQAVTLGSLLEIAIEVLDGLAELHDASLVHGDIEPDNLFLTLDGDRVRPKLIGIGHGRAVERAQGRSAPKEVAEDRDSAPEGEREENALEKGVVAGGKNKGGVDEIDEADRQGFLRSLAFSSPEQAKRMVSIGARSDLYSFAAVLYEMISGRLPHPGATEAELRTAVKTGEALPLESICQKVPLSLSKVIQRAMAFYLSARTADARTMQRELVEELREMQESIRAELLPLFSERTDGPDAVSSELEVRSGGTGMTLRIDESNLSTTTEGGVVPQEGDGIVVEHDEEDALFADERDATNEYSGPIETLGDVADEVTHPRPTEVIESEGSARDDDTEVSTPPVLDVALEVKPLHEDLLLEMDPTTVYDRRARLGGAGEGPRKHGKKRPRWLLVLIFVGSVMFSMIVGGLIAVFQSGTTGSRTTDEAPSSIQISLMPGDSGSVGGSSELMRDDAPSTDEADEALEEDMVFDAAALLDEDVLLEVDRGHVQPSPMVRWTLVGLPDNAVVRLDELEVDGPVIEVEPDGQSHDVEVEAPGFAPWSRRLTPQRDMEISVSMRRTRRSGRSKTDETPTGPRQPTKIEAEIVRNPGF